VIGTGARPVRTQRTGGGGQTEANEDTFGSHTRSKDRIPLEHARSSMVSGVQQLETPTRELTRKKVAQLTLFSTKRWNKAF
jgi:hypothetical protein